MTGWKGRTPLAGRPSTAEGTGFDGGTWSPWSPPQQHSFWRWPDTSGSRSGNPGSGSATGPPPSSNGVSTCGVVPGTSRCSQMAASARPQSSTDRAFWSVPSVRSAQVSGARERRVGGASPGGSLGAVSGSPVVREATEIELLQGHPGRERHQAGPARDVFEHRARSRLVPEDRVRRCA